MRTRGSEQSGTLGNSSATPLDDPKAAARFERCAAFAEPPTVLDDLITGKKAPLLSGDEAQFRHSRLIDGLCSASHTRVNNAYFAHPYANSP